MFYTEFMRRLVKPAVATLGLLVISLVVRQITLQGSAVITLPQASHLGGVVAQSLYTGSGNAVLPIEGKDFKLTGIRYFDHNQWVVASVTPVQNNFDPGYVVLRQHAGAYQVALGPGNDFDISYTQSLPSDVASYLLGKGLFTNGAI